MTREAPRWSRRGSLHPRGRMPPLWVAPVAISVVTVATGVVINVATDLRDNWLAWVAVAVATGLGAVVAIKLQPEPHGAPPVGASVQTTAVQMRTSRDGQVHTETSGLVMRRIEKRGNSQVITEFFNEGVALRYIDDAQRNGQAE